MHINWTYQLINFADEESSETTDEKIDDEDANDDAQWSDGEESEVRNKIEPESVDNGGEIAADLPEKVASLTIVENKE